MADQSMNLGTIFTARMDQTFTQAVTALRGALNSLGTVSNQLTNGINGANQAQSRFVQSSGNVVQATQRVNQSHKQSLQHLSTTATGWDRLKNAMMITSSYGVAATLIYSVTNALKSGTNEIIKYDQALKNLKAITGATDAEIGIMNTTILDVAANTRYSANQIADGMVLLGQAGLTAAESINSIRAVSELAGGTLEDLKKTTDLMTTTLRAYNLDAIQSGRVADVMANAMNKSKLTLDSLRIAFNYVGSSAAIMDLSIEETAASMMVLADNGMRASTVGTGLRQVLARMMSPNAQLKKSMDELGISYEQINPKMVGFQTALKTLQKVLTDDSGVVNMTKAFDIFQLRGAQAAAVITRAFTDGSWQSAMDSTYDVGSAAEMLAIQSEGLGNKLLNLVSLGKNLAISFGNAGVAGVLGTLIDALRLTVRGITAFTDNVVGSVILQMAVWTGAIYATGKAMVFLYGILKQSAMAQAISGIGAFISLLWNATKGTEALILATMAFNAINWWLVAAAAIAGVGIAIYSFANATEKARQEQEKLSESAAQSTSSLNVYKEALKEAFTSHNSKEFESLLERLKKDHPELSEAVDRNRDSYEGLAAAMDQVVATNMHAEIQATIAQIGFLNDQLDDMTKQKRLIMPWRDIEEEALKSEAGLKKLQQVSAQIASLARQINDQLSPEQRGTPVAEDWLKAHGYDVDKIGPELDKINSLLAEFEVKRKSAQAEMFSGKISEMFTVETTQNYESLYSGLSLLDQAHLTGVISNIDKELAAYRDAADEMEHTTAQRIAAEKTIVAKAVADYEAELHKEEDSEVESAQRKIDIFKKQLTDEDALNQGRVSKMTEIYNSELVLAKKNGDDTVLLTAAYNEAIKDLTQKDFEFQKEINNQILIEEKRKSEAVLKERTKNYDIESAAQQAAFNKDIQAVELSIAQRNTTEAAGVKQREAINRQYFETALAAAKNHTLFLESNYADNEDAIRKSKDNEKAIIFAATEFAISEEKRKVAEISALRNIEVEEKNQPDNQRIQAIQRQVEEERITEEQGAEAIFQIREQLMIRLLQLKKQEADDAKEQYGKKSVEYRKAVLEMEQAESDLAVFRETNGNESLNALRSEYSERVKLWQNANAEAERHYTELDELVRNNVITEEEASRRKSQLNIENLTGQEQDAKAYYEKLLTVGTSFWDIITGVGTASEKEINDARENYYRLSGQREQAQVAEKERVYAKLLSDYNLYASKAQQAADVKIHNEEMSVLAGLKTEEDAIKNKGVITENYLKDAAKKAQDHYNEVVALYPLDAEKRQEAYQQMQDAQMAHGQFQLSKEADLQARLKALREVESDIRIQGYNKQQAALQQLVDWGRITEEQAAQEKFALQEKELQEAVALAQKEIDINDAKLDHEGSAYLSLVAIKKKAQDELEAHQAKGTNQELADALAKISITEKELADRQRMIEEFYNNYDQQVIDNRMTVEQAEELKSQSTITQLKLQEQAAKDKYFALLKFNEQDQTKIKAAQEAMTAATKARVDAEINEHKRALTEKLNTYDIEFNEFNRWNDLKIKSQEAMVAAGVQSEEDGAAEVARLTKESIDKEIEMQRKKTAAILADSLSSKTEKDSARQAEMDAEKKKIDFFISESKRHYSESEKNRSDALKEQQLQLAAEEAEIENSVARRLKTEDEGYEAKKELQEKFLENQVKETETNFNKIAAHYVKDSDEYRKAEEEKINALNAYLDFQGTAAQKEFGDSSAKREADLASFRTYLDERSFALDKAVTKGVITETRAAEEKGKLEVEYAKAVLALKEKALADALLMYDTDKAGYLKALDEKKRAELDLAKLVEDLRKQRVAAQQEEFRQSHADTVAYYAAEMSAAEANEEHKRAREARRTNRKQKAQEELAVFQAQLSQESAMYDQHVARGTMTDNQATIAKLRNAILLAETERRLLRGTGATRDEKHIADMKITQAQMELETELLNQKKQLMEAAQAEIEQLKEKQTVLAEEKENIADIIESYTELIDGVETVTEKLDRFNKSQGDIEIGKEVLQDLITEWGNLRDQIQSVNERIKQIESDTVETIRELKRDLMSDDEAWQDKRLEAEELYQKAIAASAAGQYDIADELFSKSSDILSNLAGEVKDANGRIVMSQEETTQLVIDSLTEQSTAQIENLNKQKDAAVEQQAVIAAAIEDLATRLEKSINNMIGHLETFINRLSSVSVTTDDVAAANEALVQTNTKVASSYGNVIEMLEQATAAFLKYKAAGGAQADYSGYDKFAIGGKVYGPSHAAGGVPIEVEGGEYILPKDATAKIAREKGWGALENLRRGKYASGGVVSNSSWGSAQQDWIDSSGKLKQVVMDAVTQMGIGNLSKLTALKSSTWASLGIDSESSAAQGLIRDLLSSLKKWVDNPNYKGFQTDLIELISSNQSKEKIEAGDLADIIGFMAAVIKQNGGRDGVYNNTGLKNFVMNSGIKNLLSAAGDSIKFEKGGAINGPSHSGGGVHIEAEGGEYIIPKNKVSKYGLGLFESIRKGLFPVLSKAREGGIVVPALKQAMFPRLSFQSGGQVPAMAGMQNFGTLNLSVGGQEVGPVYAPVDVLQTLNNAIKRHTRMRSNK